MTSDGIQKLVGLGWSIEQVDLGTRANWCCEYCCQNLLESPDTYASWQIDHIVPIDCNGSGATENLAIACRNCNFLFKNKWNPQSNVDPSGPTDRNALIRAVRRYVANKRSEYDARLVKIRAVIASDGENRK